MSLPALTTSRILCAQHQPPPRQHGDPRKAQARRAAVGAVSPVTERLSDYSDEPFDQVIRLTAFNFLKGQLPLHGGETLPRAVLEQGFEFQGRRVPLVGPSGIFKPAVLKIPLSILTVPEVPGVARPYEDGMDAEGNFIYRYRGTDPSHPDNRGLRLAMTRQVPLIYFVGTTRARYLPLWPAFVVGDDPASLSCRIAIGVGTATLGVGLNDPAEVAEDRRRYATSMVRVRLHQVMFSEQVISAYREQCAVCRLRHRELLDAAHILPDGHPQGLPVIPNGLALCKLHHAAFDGYILGVRPDLKIEIRADVLREADGPMLQHGLQGFQGARIAIPGKAALRPRVDFLEERYELFRKAG